MQITKIGHCCLVVAENSTRVMIDPGKYSTGYEDYENIDAILITHEHGDHCHVDGVKEVLAKNPEATVYTNGAVAPLLDEAGIAYTLVADGDAFSVKDMPIEAHEFEHEEVHPRIQRVLNTGFYIASKFWYGGDALAAPDRPIEILALPVAGPWMRMRDSIDYCLAVKPKIAFPVHDGILVGLLGGSHRAPGKIFGEERIEWRIPELHAEESY